MKKLFIAAALVAAASSFASTAYAQAYVVGTVGQSKIDFCSDVPSSISCDDKDVGYKLLGGFKFTPNIGVEGGYVNLGKATFSGTDGADRIDNGEIKASGVMAALVLSAPIQDFEVFAKLGLAHLKAKAKATVTTTTTTVVNDGEEGQIVSRAITTANASLSDKSTNVVYGVGAAYHFTPNLGVRLEFERFRAKLEGEKGDINLLSAGLVYRF